mmetsp:Transcript_7580/g.9388  ORF Transcript_7580/g.9388 Transcript_7580/m.9388 type:complete len:235 (-) Transcript_7580:566-1270(-)
MVGMVLCDIDLYTRVNKADGAHTQNGKQESDPNRISEAHLAILKVERNHNGMFYIVDQFCKVDKVLHDKEQYRRDFHILIVSHRILHMNNNQCHLLQLTAFLHHRTKTFYSYHSNKNDPWEWHTVHNHPHDKLLYICASYNSTDYHKYHHKIYHHQVHHNEADTQFFYKNISFSCQVQGTVDKILDDIFVYTNEYMLYLLFSFYKVHHKNGGLNKDQKLVLPLYHRNTAIWRGL